MFTLIASGKSFSSKFLKGNYELLGWFCVLIDSFVSEYLKTLSQNNMDELQEMYESVVPAFAEAYPDVFNLKEFSMQSFILADHILNYYSIDNPLAIVPL